MIGKEESGDLEKIFLVSRLCDCGRDRQMPHCIPHGRDRQTPPSPVQPVDLKRMSTDSSRPHFSPFSIFLDHHQCVIRTCHRIILSVLSEPSNISYQYFLILLSVLSEPTTESSSVCYRNLPPGWRRCEGRLQ